jgi:hypothetical protein
MAPLFRERGSAFIWRTKRSLVDITPFRRSSAKALGHFPNTEKRFTASDENKPAVGRKRDAVYGLSDIETAKLLSRLNIPEPKCVVLCLHEIAVPVV